MLGSWGTRAASVAAITILAGVVPVSPMTPSPAAASASPSDVQRAAPADANAAPPTPGVAGVIPLSPLSGVEIGRHETYFAAAANAHRAAGIPGFAVSPSDPAGEPAAGAAAANDAIHLGAAAGDLTGDGLDDAFVRHYPDPWAPSFSARSGIDGSELWRVDVTGSYGYIISLPGDVSGDGADDVLVTTFVFERASGAHVTYHWSVQLLSGPDGAALWSKTFPGEGVVGGGLPGVDYVAYTPNVVVLAYPAGDTDGDGDMEIAISALDAVGLDSEVGPATLIVVGQVALVRTNAELVDAATGAAIASRFEDWSETYGAMLPGADWSGDGHPDIAWLGYHIAAPGPAGKRGLLCSYSNVTRDCYLRRPVNMWAEALRGGDLAVLWSTYAGAPDAFPVSVYTPADLTGDGLADLLYIADTTRRAWRLQLLSGADGSVVWTRDMSDELEQPPVVTASIDGGAGLDLVRLNGSSDWSKHFFRNDGATGADLFVTNMTVPPRSPGSWDRYFGSTIIPDVDGDGIHDAAFLILEGVRDLSSNLHLNTLAEVHSGATPSVLTTWAHAGSFDYVRGVGDIDGDGRRELVGESTRIGGPDVGFARSTETGAELWNLLLIDDHSEIYATTADQSGGVGDDILVSDNMRGVPVRSVDGATGVVRWQAP